MADHDYDIKLKTSSDTRGAKAVARSVADIERELKDVEKSFRNAKAGSKQFTDQKNRIQALNAELRKTTTAARGLGKRGNGGLAALEFSRAIEDAQYGVRGVLNNIPQLVMMLGGGAGLAGAISIAAVAGSQLWSRLNGGTKTGKALIKEYEEALEKVREEYDKLREGESKQREEREKQSAQQLKEALEDSSDAQSASAFSARMEAEIEHAESLLQLAKARVKAENLAHLAASSSGEDAVKYAEQRADLIQSIYEQEMAMAEAKRQAALREARIAMLGSQSALHAKQTSFESAEDEYHLAAGRRAASQAKLDAKRAQREALLADKQARYDSLNASIKAAMESQKFSAYGGLSQSGDSAKAMALKREIDHLQNPWHDENVLLEEVNSFAGEIQAASEEFTAAGEAVRMAAREFEQSAEAVKRLEEHHDVQRNAEQSSVMARLEGQTASSARAGLDVLRGANGLSYPGQQQVNAAIAGVENMLSDEISDAEQAEKIRGQWQLLTNNLHAKDQAMLEGMADADRNIKSVITQIEALKDKMRSDGVKINQLGN